MEKTSEFDLNHAVQQWREGLTQSPAFCSENFEELESHLRDSIATLQSRGLSAEEALVVAVRRIGKGCALEQEFRKVNGHAVWLDRILWMLIGFQFWVMVSIAYSTTQRVVRGVLWWTFEGDIGVSELGFKLGVILLPPVFLALVLFLGWRFLKRAESRARDVFGGLLLKPLRLALALFLAAFCLSLLGDGVMGYWIEPVFYKNVPHNVDWKFFLMRADSLLLHAVGAVFIWILARKRLRGRMA